MWPPLLRVLLHEPALLIEHGAGYAELIGEEAIAWQSGLKRRLGLWLALIGCGALALLFGGVALMLYAVTATAHWLLWAVPAVPLVALLAAAGLLARHDRGSAAFPRLRVQVDRDLQLFGLTGTDR